MRLSQNPKPEAAFTWLEVLVIVVVVLLLSLVLPRYMASKQRAQRISCIGNLKIIGLSIRAWGIDRGDQFPWLVSTNRGGTLEYAASAEVFRHYLVISNELASFSPLACPADRHRVRVSRLTNIISNINVSYFVGLDANEQAPQSILSGDRNLSGGTTNGAWLIFGAKSVPGWDATIHQHAGNLGLGDGSVMQTTTEMLVRQFASARQSMTNSDTIRLAVPRVPGDEGAFDGVIFGIHVPVPLVGAVVIGAGLLAGWWFVRRRILANAAEASISDAGTPSELLDETGPK